MSIRLSITRQSCLTPPPAGIGSPAYAPFDDGVIEVVTVERVVEPADQAGETARDAGAHAVPDTAVAPDVEIMTEPDTRVEQSEPELEPDQETTVDVSDPAGGGDDSPTGPDEPAGLL